MSLRSDKSMKFLIRGDPGVSKTCIFFRFANDSFNSSYVPKIGIDYSVKALDVHNQKVKLQIWDISGRRKFLDYIASHFRGAFGVILVYDVTNEESFINLIHWMQFVNDVGDPNVEKVIIDNKCDLQYHRVISRRQGETLAKENNDMF
jgi:Ras-related protein Rab-8A